MSNSPKIVIITTHCPAPKYQALTYPRFRSYLTTTDPATMQPDCLVIGAQSAGLPVGLALVSPAYGNAERRLFSVFVSSAFRQLDIGTMLIAEVERTARQAGTQKLVAFHSRGNKGYKNYEGLVRKAGWSEPELSEYRLGGRASWISEAEKDWEKFLVRAKRGGFNATDWTALTDADRAQILWLVEHELPEADISFNPLNYDSPHFVPEISVVLRCGEEIAGWVLGSKGATENAFYYSHGYALPKYQRRGYLIVGMMEVCRRQVDLFGPESLSTYQTRNPAMQRLMEQRIKPYSEWTDERMICVKNLSD